MTRLVILDRDGVVNQDSEDFIKSPEEFVPLPGSLEAIARLNAAGYSVAVASNQSGIARGLFSEATLETMHRKLHDLLEAVGGHIDGIFYCPHGPDDHCDCRKPEPGLLRQIGEHFGVDLAGVPVVGDSLRDLQSAMAVGAMPILVLTGKGEYTHRQLSNAPSLSATPVYADLAQAVDVLLAGALSGDAHEDHH